jgi:hypothetical protein
MCAYVPRPGIALGSRAAASTRTRVQGVDAQVDVRMAGAPAKASCVQRYSLNKVFIRVVRARDGLRARDVAESGLYSLT